MQQILDVYLLQQEARVYAIRCPLWTGTQRAMIVRLVRVATLKSIKDAVGITFHFNI